MPLENGTRLGPYEITALLGAGGMGEVYRAIDTRLHRTVAVKVLSGHLSVTAERRERFRREARAISSLSHPRVCALYDVGEDEGRDFLVLEYLEGETLADRIRRGPLPMGEALRIGAGIAEGLDAAHRQGLIHRDLKPANIMLSRSGVKLMDFGLAKAVGLDVQGEGVLSEAPTANPPLTAQGSVLGTLNYIAPEQLEGKDADSSSDVFSLGAILHEMVTGRKAFEADTAAGVIAAVLATDSPSVSELRPSVPPALAHLVRTCLSRDRENRRWNAHDLRIDLEFLAEKEAVGDLPGSTPRGDPVRAHLIWGAVVLVLAALAVLSILRPGADPPSPPSVRFLLPAPPETAYSTSVETHNIALSPDGQALAFVSVESGQPWIWIRPLSSNQARRLPGTDGAMSPFWSPDGRNVAFFRKGSLVRLPVDGGPAQILCAVTGVEWTGDWSAGGDILFTEFVGREGVHHVPATGGEPALALDPSAVRQSGFRWPHWLPDGEHFLYSAFDEQGDLRLYAGEIGTGESRVVLPVPTRAQYAAPYLLYAQHRTLMAQPFDAARLQVTGEPFPLAESVPYFLTGWAPFSVSGEGPVLAYQAGDTSSQLAWFDREGRQLSTVGERADYVSARLSPDGQKVAAVIDRDGESSDIWLIDVSRGARTRFTSEAGRKSPAVWSPDGNRVVYGIHGKEAGGIVVRTVDGEGSTKVVPALARFQFPSDWSSDGRWILFAQVDPEAGFDIWAAPQDGTDGPARILGTGFHEWEAVLSPDGNWMAYLSDEAGRSSSSLQVTPGTLDVFVRPFRRPGEPVRISSDGGFAPRWSRGGRELFYLRADGSVRAVRISVDDGLRVGDASTLFRLPSLPDPESLGAMFSVSADGQRFLAAVGGTAASLPITVSVNWTAGLGRDR